MAGHGFEDQWRTRFEEFADLRNDDAGIAGWTTTGLEARVRRFLTLWRPRDYEQQWLDAGCGAGTYTRILLRHRQQVFGVDYSLPTLRKAMARNPETMFAAADVRILPFRQEQFDGALCFGVTQALADSGPVVRELARLVRPGGQLWIDALNGWCLPHALEALRCKILNRPTRLRYESPRRIKRQCNDYGFSNVELHWMPIMPSRLQRLQRTIEGRRISWVVDRMPLLGALLSHSFMIRATKLAAHPQDQTTRSQPHNMRHPANAR